MILTLFVGPWLGVMFVAPGGSSIDVMGFLCVKIPLPEEILDAAADGCMVADMDISLEDSRRAQT